MADTNPEPSVSVSGTDSDADSDTRPTKQTYDALKATIDKGVDLYRAVMSLPSDKYTTMHLRMALLQAVVTNQHVTIMLGCGTNCPKEVEFIHMTFNDPAAVSKVAEMAGDTSSTDELAKKLQTLHRTAYQVANSIERVSSENRKPIIDKHRADIVADYEKMILGCIVKMYTSRGPYGVTPSEPYLPDSKYTGPWFHLDVTRKDRRAKLSRDLFPVVKFGGKSGVPVDIVKGVMEFLPTDVKHLLQPHAGSPHHVTIPPDLVEQLVTNGKLKPSMLLYCMRGAARGDQAKKVPLLNSQLELAIQQYHVKHQTPLVVDFHSYKNRTGVLTVPKNDSKVLVADITQGVYGEMFKTTMLSPPNPNDYIFPHKTFTLAEDQPLDDDGGSERILDSDSDSDRDDDDEDGSADGSDGSESGSDDES